MCGSDAEISKADRHTHISGASFRKLIHYFLIVFSGVGELIIIISLSLKCLACAQSSTQLFKESNVGFVVERQESSLASLCVSWIPVDCIVGRTCNEDGRYCRAACFGAHCRCCTLYGGAVSASSLSFWES